MAEIVDFLIWAVSALLVSVLLRWWWLFRERRKLSRLHSAFEAQRFDTVYEEDEDDKCYSGRVIKILRARVIEGRVEVHWLFHPQFIQKGFELSGKCRRNDGSWEPLAFAPFQDSGSWIECFNYGESRSYLFSVAKKYRFFFGLVSEEPREIVYDQISFSVRKGKYLKERRELIRDRRELGLEVREYLKIERELKRSIASANAATRQPIEDPLAEEFNSRLTRKTKVADFLEQYITEIRARADWSDERKKRAIEEAELLADEMKFEEQQN
jgi:hypothetical protein